MITTIYEGYRYRLGAAMVLFNALDEVLVCKRRGVCPPEWQFPQGGRDEGEGAEDALFREMHEELAIERGDMAVIGRLPQKSRYLLPEKFRGKRGFDGQIHDWFAVRYLKGGLPDFASAQDKEFSEVAWRSPYWVMNNTSEFRMNVYRHVIPAALALVQRAA